MKIFGELAAYFIKIEAIAIFANSNDRRDRHARADGWSNARARPLRQRSVHHATHRSPCNPLFTIPPECGASGAGKPRFGAPKSRGSVCLSVRLSGV
ncbi:MAG TPA: hypothetical protein VH249_01115 [Xanthobacteraceae bacterium]|jgi:hypothetical protein|nr:hypothetical protein [Xanthobacteraceae bacterium]